MTGSAAPSWMSWLYNVERPTDDDIVAMFDMIERHFHDDKDGLDAALGAIDVDRLAPELMVGIARGLFPAAEHLRNWRPFVDRACASLSGRNLDAGELMQGLMAEEKEYVMATMDIETEIAVIVEKVLRGLAAGEDANEAVMQAVTDHIRKSGLLEEATATKWSVDDDGQIGGSISFDSDLISRALHAASAAVDRWRADNAEIERILSMSEEELDAELRAEGLDPDQVVAESRAEFERALEKVGKSVRRSENEF